MRNKRVSSSRTRKRQHLLEVSVRRDIAVRQRNRKVAMWVFKVVMLVAVAGGLWFGGREALRVWLWENPEYHVVDVEVRTDGVLTKDQVMAAAGLRKGSHILEVHPRKAREKIDDIPQVDRAEVQRIFPNRVVISITERRPVAWVTENADEDPTVSENAFLIDNRGVVMRSKRMLEEYRVLPHISGVPLGNLTPGQVIKTFEMNAALELLRLNGTNPRWQARNIDLAKRYCLVVTDRNRAKITFGIDEVERQLARLYKLLDLVEVEQKEIQTVNLLVERNIPVTFAELPPMDEGTGDENAEAAGDAAEPVRAEQVAPVAEKAATPEPRRSTGGTASKVTKPSRTRAATPIPMKRATRNTSPRKPSTPAPTVKRPFRNG